MQLLGALDPRHRHEALERPRHLDDGDLVFAPESVAPAQPHDEVERLVGHLGEGVRRVQPHRQQQRLHLVDEVLAHPAALARIALAVRDDADAALFQRGQQLVVVDRVLAFHQGVHPFGQGAVGIDRGGPPLLVGQAGRVVRREADLEKLIQVGRHDGQVAQPLQQRDVGAAGPVEHALVEGQDALVAIEKNVAVDGVQGSVGHGRGQGRDRGAEAHGSAYHYFHSARRFDDKSMTRTAPCGLGYRLRRAHGGPPPWT